MLVEPHSRRVLQRFVEIINYGDQARTIIYNVTIQLSSRLGISTLCHKQKCWTFLGGVPT